MADLAQDVLRRFRSWIEKPSTEDPRTLFAPNVVYDRGWGQRVGEDFFSDLDLYAPLEEVTWVAEFVSGEGAALAYNATDPVTLNRLRVVSMLEVRDGQICSMVGAAAIIPPDTFIQYVTGDATQPRAKGPRVIAHVCNDIGGWGKGFVLAISKRWPQPGSAYRSWAQGKGDAHFALGEAQFVQVEPLLWVANMVAQHGIRATKDGPPIRYEALVSALRKVAEFALANNATVHMPRIGCGLAGGDWAKIEPIIKTTLAAKYVRVFVYDLPSDSRGDGSSCVRR